METDSAAGRLALLLAAFEDDEWWWDDDARESSDGARLRERSLPSRRCFRSPPPPEFAIDLVLLTVDWLLSLEARLVDSSPWEARDRTEAPSDSSLRLRMVLPPLVDASDSSP